jgi:hypothetical protein
MGKTHRGMVWLCPCWISLAIHAIPTKVPIGTRVQLLQERFNAARMEIEFKKPS